MNFECEYCGFMCGYEEEHKASYTCFYNEYQHRKSIENSLTGLDLTRNTKRIWDLEEYLKDRDCSKCNMTLESPKALIEHEEMCVARTIIDTTNQPIENPRIYSSEQATCELCGKVYKHTSKNIKPQYGLNRHMKTCRQNLKRNLKSELNILLNETDVGLLKECVDFLKKKVDTTIS